MVSAIEVRWWEHIFLALLALIGLYAVFRGQPAAQAQSWDSRARAGMYRANALVLLAIGGLTLASWRLAGRPLSDMGLRWGRVDSSAVGLVALFVAFYTANAWYRLTGPRRAVTVAELRRDTPFLPTNLTELRTFGVLALSAGVNEEILFRGFMISYFVALFGPTRTGLLLALLVPAVGFALVHRYQSWAAVAMIFATAVLFGAIFVTTGSVVIPILLHIGMDMVSGWLAVQLIAGEGEALDDSGAA